MWDLQQCKCRHTLIGHTKPVQRLVLSGERLYSTAGSTVRVWDLQTLQCLDVLHSHSDGGSLCGLALDEAGLVYVGGQVRPFVQFCPPGVRTVSQRQLWQRQQSCAGLPMLGLGTADLVCKLNHSLVSKGLQ